MKKHEKIEETVSPGKPYTLEEGYYEGGTVTAEGLGTQTPGDAEEGDILAGKTAWVKGLQVKGNMPNQGDLNKNHWPVITRPFHFHRKSLGPTTR